MTISNDTKQFATYVLADLFPKLALATGNAQEFIGQIQKAAPEVGLSDVQNREVSREMWVERIASVIVDHYAQRYTPDKLRQSA